ncbi:hypothetical protein ACP70R_008810 [Stipagrostis hirtigluma subsp. patula]
MGMATTERTAPAASTDRLLQLLSLSLSLSLSPASKAIGKGGRQQLRVRLPDGEFRCRTCGRRFATFQALGGHRTSHRRPRVRADGLDLLLGARPGKGAAAATTAVHRCNACGVVFPTGQALGGHMRRHRAAYEAAAVLETMTASSSASEEGDDDIDDEGLLPSTLIQFL